MKTDKEYHRINAELVRVLSERDAARNALFWCLRQMPEPSRASTDTGDYMTGYLKAREALGRVSV